MGDANMISEKCFANNYPAFWKSLFPLSKIFMRGMVLESNKNIHELELQTSGRRLSFVSEMGFQLFSNAIIGNQDLLDSIKMDDVFYQSIEEKCTAKFDLYEDNEDILNNPLDHEEFSDAVLIAKRLFSRFQHENMIKTTPLFYGCGMLDNCYGDILVSDTLYEVKFINRNFNNQDLRQIITYCALNYASKQYVINYVALYNPRRNCTYRCEVNSFAEAISGTSFNDMCWNIIMFLSQEQSSK